MSPHIKFQVALPSREMSAYDAVLAQGPMRLVVAANGAFTQISNVDADAAYEAQDAQYAHAGSAPPVSGERVSPRARAAMFPKPARIPRAA